MDEEQSGLVPLIVGAAVEGQMRQINRRVECAKGLWLGNGAEALPQVRAAPLSAEDRAQCSCSHPCLSASAARLGRLSPAV